MNLKFNVKKRTLCIAGASVAAAGLGFVVAPAIAAFAGSVGILGAASTGTAISSLSGAALTSASLAAVGSGTMASGKALIAIKFGNIAYKGLDALTR